MKIVTIKVCGTFHQFAWMQGGLVPVEEWNLRQAIEQQASSYPLDPTLTLYANPHAQLLRLTSLAIVGNAELLERPRKNIRK